MQVADIAVVEVIEGTRIPIEKNPLMVVLNVALIVLFVLLALDCLFVSALLVADAAPLIRKWPGIRPSRQPTAARKTL